MKIFIAVLITAFLSLLSGQAFAAISSFPGQSIETLNASLICAEENDEDAEKKKKKKDDELPEETEPECD